MPAYAPAILGVYCAAAAVILPLPAHSLLAVSQKRVRRSLPQLFEPLEAGAIIQLFWKDEAKVGLTSVLLQHSLDNTLQLRQDAPD